MNDVVAEEQRPERLMAGFHGYEDGAEGPAFAGNASEQSPLHHVWPQWSDTLPVPEANTRKVEGGMRLNGVLKSGTLAKPLISYITVVRNNVQTLERTIVSVRQQTYANVEHIIVDGLSTDGTLEIILGHANQIDYFVSEPDNGLYDALNKTIPLARGQLICILNSDDWLERNAAEIAAKHMAGVNGNYMLLTAAKVRDGGGVHNWLPAFVHPGSYFICANACHNGIYATRAAYESSGPYDSSYRIAADFKWIMDSLESGSIFRYTSEATVNYSLGGISSDVERHYHECVAVVRERFPFLTRQELDGLAHCFFVFQSNIPQSAEKPASSTEFLRGVYLQHSANTEFLYYLGWACMANYLHPRKSLFLSLLETRTAVIARQIIFTRYPKLYKALRKLVSRFR